MTYLMASIIRKTLRGRTYYYARECRRVDGKPKIVWQKYLGKAEDIVAAVGQPQPPALVSTVVTEFGAVAALFDLANAFALSNTSTAMSRLVAVRQDPASAPICWSLP